MPLYAVTNMENVSNDRCFPTESTEPTIHDLLTRIQAVSCDLVGTSTYIRSTLLGNDGPPCNAVNKGEITCTKDHIMSILDTLEDAYNTLAFVRDRL